MDLVFLLEKTVTQIFMCIEVSPKRLITRLKVEDIHLGFNPHRVYLELPIQQDNLVVQLQSCIGLFLLMLLTLFIINVHSMLQCKELFTSYHNK